MLLKYLPTLNETGGSGDGVECGREELGIPYKALGELLYILAKASVSLGTLSSNIIMNNYAKRGIGCRGLYLRT